MSLLLEALRKADRERQNQTAAPGLDAHHAPAKSSPHKLLWLAGGLLFLVVLLSAMLFWVIHTAGLTTNKSSVNASAHSSAAARALSSAAAANNLTNNVTNNAALKHLAPTPAPALTNTAQRHELAVKKTPLIAPRSALASSTQSSSSAASKRPVNTEVAALYQPNKPPAVARASTQAKAHTSASASVASAAAPRANKLSNYPRVGVIRDLPLSIQNSIPTLIYGAHNYRPKGHSVVVINGKQWREGQKISASVTLEKILADGIIMRAAGKRFKLKALSSWVNM